MNKIIFALVFVAVSYLGSAQEFQGMAVYESKPVPPILKHEWRKQKYDSGRAKKESRKV
jgi:hypothetical protein